MSRVCSCPVPAPLAQAACLLALLAGCADSEKTYPVSGKITLGERPLTVTTTVVLFKPDKSRGNTTPFEPAGTVDEEGNYTVSTGGKKGAPPGWYSVVVTATQPTEDVVKGPRRHHPVPRSLLPARYGQPQTSGLSVEVVEEPAPGAYDLKLTR